ncbi:hypothetical protein BV95_04220 [Sphingobium chlorophenolicum]|uniref:Uncharacterized protein n=1 Tax=Sphingobium chlorophenolicum TaxID=46429 RepID=A0A081R8I5_SPHCR|nr:hypothetical protein BV95_04220 [Sphingobium chlorophenolicum]
MAMVRPRERTGKGGQTVAQVACFLQLVHQVDYVARPFAQGEGAVALQIGVGAVILGGEAFLGLQRLERRLALFQILLALGEGVRRLFRRGAQGAAAVQFGAQTGGAFADDGQHLPQHGAHVDGVVDRSGLDQRQRQRALRHHLERGGQAHDGFLLGGEAGGLGALEPGDDGDAGLRGLNVGLRLLDAGRHGGGAAAGLIGFVAGGGGLAFEAFGAQAGFVRLAAGGFERGLFFGEAGACGARQDDRLAVGGGQARRRKRCRAREECRDDRRLFQLCPLRA